MVPSMIIQMTFNENEKKSYRCISSLLFKGTHNIFRRNLEFLDILGCLVRIQDLPTSGKLYLLLRDNSLRIGIQTRFEYEVQSDALALMWT